MITATHKEAQDFLRRVQLAPAEIEQLDDALARSNIANAALLNETTPLLASNGVVIQDLTVRSEAVNQTLQSLQTKNEELNKRLDAIENDPIRRISLLTRKMMRDCTECTKTLCYRTLGILICTTGGYGCAMLWTNTMAIHLLGAVGGAMTGVGGFFFYEKFKKCCSRNQTFNIQNHPPV